MFAIQILTCWHVLEQIVVTMPLLLFAQARFFNGNQPCQTDEQTNSDRCKAAMASVASIQGKTQFIQSLLSFLASPIIGRLSDSIGRKVASRTPRTYGHPGLVPTEQF